MCVGQRFRPAKLIIFGFVIPGARNPVIFARRSHGSSKRQLLVIIPGVVIPAVRNLGHFRPPMSRILKMPIFSRNPCVLVSDFVLPD